MKKYEKQIQDAKDKIVALNKGSKKHSASVLESKINNLERFIRKEDAEGAEKAAAELGGDLKTIEVPVQEEVNTGKKNSKG